MVLRYDMFVEETGGSQNLLQPSCEPHAHVEVEFLLELEPEVDAAADRDPYIGVNEGIRVEDIPEWDVEKANEWHREAGRRSFECELRVRVQLKPCLEPGQFPFVTDAKRFGF